jgi:hypothetical protein
MFAKLTRAAVLGFAAVAAVALPACAETAVAPAARAARVEYRYFGQGSYGFVTPSNDTATYALTGRRNVDTRWDNQNVRVIDAGQTRIILPNVNR